VLTSDPASLFLKGRLVLRTAGYWRMPRSFKDNVHAVPAICFDMI
jgi:hypothetical protein